MTGETATLLIGGGGALGRAMVDAWPSDLPPPTIWDRIAVPHQAGAALDLMDPGAVAEAATRLPERLHVVHLAARLDVGADPEATRQSISANVAALLVPASALADRIATFTHVSSISVYGSGAHSPIRENAQLRPNSVYGAGKAAAETVSGALARMWGWRHCVFRPTQLFALSSADQSLPHLLMSASTSKRPLTLNADPQSLRDYLHVNDAAALLIEQCRLQRQGIYNVGAGAPVSLGDMFKTSSDRWNLPPVQAAPFAPRVDQYLDVSHTLAAFAWRPRNPVLEWLAQAEPGIG